MPIEREVPEEIKRKVLEKVSNKSLAEIAFKYIKLVEKEDGSHLGKGRATRHQ
jgi:hypothetical protein